MNAHEIEILAQRAAIRVETIRNRNAFSAALLAFARELRTIRK